jgi:hypothetical protein
VSFKKNLTPLMFVAHYADQHPAIDTTLIDFLIMQGAYLEFTNSTKVRSHPFPWDMSEMGPPHSCLGYGSLDTLSGFP